MNAPWLERMPAEWREIPLQHLATIETGSRDTVDAVDGGDYPFFIRSPHQLAINSFGYDTEAILTPGDGNVGEIFHHVHGKFDAHQRVYVIHDFHGVEGRFLYWYFSSEFQRVVSYGGAQTTVASLRRSMFTSFPVAVPPAPTQKRIADYLDRETSEIDAMLAKMDELTETLEARRTSVVDRELLPHVGVSTARHGLVAEAITGLTYAPADVVDSGGTVVHRSGSIQKSRIDRSDLIRVATPIPDKLRLRDGDLLVCSRNGSAHLVGKNAIIGKEEVGETWGAFMTVLRSPNNRYVRWYLQSTLFADERSQYSTSTINQLTIGMINRMEIPFPPLDEQTRIADHLDEVTGKIDQMLAKTAELKSLLIERRSALITDVVTGKKQVHS